MKMPKKPWVTCSNQYLIMVSPAVRDSPKVPWVSVSVFGQEICREETSEVCTELTDGESVWVDMGLMLCCGQYKSIKNMMKDNFRS